MTWTFFHSLCQLSKILRECQSVSLYRSVVIRRGQTNSKSACGLLVDRAVWRQYHKPLYTQLMGLLGCFVLVGPRARLFALGSGSFHQAAEALCISAGLTQNGSLIQSIGTDDAWFHADHIALKRHSLVRRFSESILQRDLKLTNHISQRRLSTSRPPLMSEDIWGTALMKWNRRGETRLIKKEAEACRG